MGYYSYYTLTLKLLPEEGENKLGELIEPIRKLIIDRLIDENESANSAIDENGIGNDWVTWYEYKEEIAELSLNYPGVIFVINREGEDREDAEITLVLNGAVVSAMMQTIYPDVYNLYRAFDGADLSPYASTDIQFLLALPLPEPELLASKEAEEENQA